MELSEAKRKEQFLEIFTMANLQDGSSIKRLIKMGGDQGIAQKLGTDIKVFFGCFLFPW